MILVTLLVVFGACNVAGSEGQDRFLKAGLTGVLTEAEIDSLISEGGDEAVALIHGKEVTKRQFIGQRLHEAARSESWSREQAAAFVRRLNRNPALLRRYLEAWTTYTALLMEARRLGIERTGIFIAKLRALEISA